MRNTITIIIEAAQALNAGFRDVLSRHFSCSIGGSMPGLYVRLPFTRLSAWVEWGTPGGGLGLVRSSEHDVEFFLGTVRGVLSAEPKGFTA